MKKFYVTFLFFAISIGLFSQENSHNTSEIGLVFNNLSSFGVRYKLGNDHIMFRITSLVLNGTNTSTNLSRYSYNGINQSNISSNPANTFGTGLNLGFEKRNWIGQKSYFSYGIDWINSYTKSTSNATTPNSSTFHYTDLNGNYLTMTQVYYNTSSSNIWTASSGLGIFVGFFFKINDLFSIGAELEPSISYKYTSTGSSSLGYGVHWTGNSTSGYTSDVYVNSATTQTTINKGLSYGLTNASASITIIYKFARLVQK